jgi:hypothetical protein
MKYGLTIAYTCASSIMEGSHMMKRKPRIKISQDQRQKNAARGECGQRSPCTSAVLEALGIDKSKYHYSQYTQDVVAVLRRHGYSVRSRLSSLPKHCSVGKARQRLADMSNTEMIGKGFTQIPKYLIEVQGHVLLLNALGTTIMDTASRKRDRRTILRIYKVVEA